MPHHLKLAKQRTCQQAWARLCADQGPFLFFLILFALSRGVDGVVYTLEDQLPIAHTQRVVVLETFLVVSTRQARPSCLLGLLNRIIRRVQKSTLFLDNVHLGDVRGKFELMTIFSVLRVQF